MTTRTCGSRTNVTWGKNGGRRTRTIAATLTVFAGLALATAPIAGAASKNTKGVASWVR
jgi:hypothetical protein